MTPPRIVPAVLCAHKKQPIFIIYPFLCKVWTRQECEVITSVSQSVRNILTAPTSGISKHIHDSDSKHTATRKTTSQANIMDQQRNTE